MESLIEFLAPTFDVVGKILIAYTALAVHHRVRKEHKIDELVFREMRREQVLGVVGVVFILAAYVLELPPVVDFLIR